MSIDHLSSISLRGDKMKQIIIDWGWFYDVFQCPDYIVDDIQNYEAQFYQWLENKDNDHGYWGAYPQAEAGIPDPYLPRDPNGQDFVCWGVEALIDWLNKYAINRDNDEKVVLTEFQFDDRDILQKMVDSGIVRIYG